MLWKSRFPRRRLPIELLKNVDGQSSIEDSSARPHPELSSAINVAPEAPSRRRDLTLEHLEDTRKSTVLFHLTKRCLTPHARPRDNRTHLFVP